MTLKEIAEIAIGEGSAEKCAVDGWGGMPVGWGMRGNYGKSLAEHDKQFHHGHYDGGKCSLRDTMSLGDDSDSDLEQGVFLFPDSSYNHSKNTRQSNARGSFSWFDSPPPRKFKEGPTIEIGAIKDMAEDKVTALPPGDFNSVMALLPDEDKIFALSDVHEAKYDDIDPKAHGTVIIAGDFSNSGFTSESRRISMEDAVENGRKWLDEEFFPMVRSRPNQQFLLIAGNHDHYLGDESADDIEWPENVTYLKDSAAEINGMKVYGTPWCESKPWASNMRQEFAQQPFEVSAEKCKAMYDKIPEGLDVLIVHQPPKDEGFDGDFSGGKNCGSTALADAIKRAKPKLVICGHMHEGDHRPYKIGDSVVMNCAHVSGRSDPSYKAREIGIIRPDDEEGRNGFIIDGESDHKKARPPKAKEESHTNKANDDAARHGKENENGHQKASSIYWFS